MNNIVTEYGLIGLEEDKNFLESYKFKSIVVDKKIYQELEVFAKTDKGRDIIGFSSNGKFLQVKNYVGIIQTKSGFTLEILPKIYNQKEEKLKAIFLKLLEILHKIPNYKHTQYAKLNTINQPLLEIFIKMFLDEIGKIIQIGLKQDYINKKSNEKFLKGKLLVSQNIKYNHIQKNRFYISYNDYNQNRVENRVLKSTLKFLLKISKSFKNQKLCRIYLAHFSNVEFSTNIKADLKKCNISLRGMQYYKNAIIWANIFLENRSFSSFKGDTIAFALLYPMERLFENYVEFYLKRRYKRLKIIPQKEAKFVPELFNLRADILIKKEEKNLVVADAKWKLINKNSDFSQSDFYQLYAYSKAYNVNNLRLYYPMNENFKKIKQYRYFDDINIYLIPIELKEIIE